MAFRDRLAKAGPVEKLFWLPNRQLSRDGIIVNAGKMVDASFVEVPIQRNPQDDNEIIKEGEVPEDWGENNHCEKDTDARWTRHNRKKYFGYENHVKADTKTKLLTAYKVTTANIHDSRVIKNLIEKEDAGEPLYADSAYRSESTETFCKKMGVGAGSMKRDAGTSRFKKNRRMPTRRNNGLGRGWNTSSPSWKTR